MKLFLHGPPAAGKSTLAVRLCRHYNLHHIQLSPLLEEALALLERSFPAEGEEDAQDDEENEDKQLVRRITNVREEARDRGEDLSLEHVLEDQLVTRFVREKLKSMPCQNQGFVLEGYPRTYEQAKDLFAIDDVEESTAEESRQISTDPVISPSHVFILHAQDEFLRERVLHLPERQMMLSYKTDAMFARQLADYRDTNHEDESRTAVSVFAEEDVVIENLDIPTDLDGDKGTLFQAVLDKIGDQGTMEVSPHQKDEDLVQEMVHEMKRLAQEEAAQQTAAQQDEEQKSLQEKQQFMAYEKSVQEEMEHLTDLSVPLRNFLMTYVLPTLIKGLTKTCEERPSPDQCIDFLAEYLFKNNPQVGYTFSGPVPWREDEFQETTAEPITELAETPANEQPETTEELC